MKVYRLAVKDTKTNKEIFLAKFNKKYEAEAALRRSKSLTNAPEIEFYLITAEVLEEKK